METKFIEAMHKDGTGNWGKFAVGRFTPEEWARPSIVAPEFGSLIGQRGWTRSHLWVFDLQTGESAWFLPGGLASADLNKHKIWVCPMFPRFLEWLYEQDLSDLDALPSVVEFGHDEISFDFQGQRYPGPEGDEQLES